MEKEEEMIINNKCKPVDWIKNNRELSDKQDVRKNSEVPTIRVGIGTPIRSTNNPLNNLIILYYLLQPNSNIPYFYFTL